ncbi:MAG: prefoldin subunit alpha [Thaumarchaeota archaeon]|nr:prefoldin subunit alpha [Nitrososphaerota archaeon]
MSDQEKLQSVAANLKMMEEYLNELTQRAQMVTGQVIQGRGASEAVQSLNSGAQEILVPLGSSVYLKLKSSSDIGKLVVGIGANVAVEKSKDEALVSLDESVKALEGLNTSIQAQRNELEQRIGAARAELNEIVQQAQSKQGMA